MEGGGRPLAVVRIRLADAAPEFVAGALDLLAAVEESDPVLVTDAALEAAAELRRIATAGGW